MVKVYFETTSYAELVAVFDSEETYEVCIEALERQAKENGFLYVTESIDEETNLGDDKKYAVILVGEDLEETTIFEFNSYDESIEVASSFSLKFPTLNIQIKKV